MNVAHLFSRQIFIFQALNFWVHVAMLKVDMFAIRHLLQTTLELQS
jgi:ABC-type histidine transport system ATPase subunit